MKYMVLWKPGSGSFYRVREFVDAEQASPLYEELAGLYRCQKNQGAHVRLLKFETAGQVESHDLRRYMLLGVYERDYHDILEFEQLDEARSGYGNWLEFPPKIGRKTPEPYYVSVRLLAFQTIAELRM